MSGICNRDRIFFIGLQIQGIENSFKFLKFMESDFLEIEEFSDRRLIMEISVIERDDRIRHRIFEISQIEFDYFIHQDMGIRESCEIIFSQWDFLDPITKRKMEFFDRFLVSGERISLLEFLKERLSLFCISEIT